MFILTPIDLHVDLRPTAAFVEELSPGSTKRWATRVDQVATSRRAAGDVSGRAMRPT